MTLLRTPRYPLAIRSALIALVLFTALAQAQQRSTDLKTLARSGLAQLQGTISVPGLDSAVEVRRDRWGVPHIYAKTQRDLFFAQGFVAAQDRLFQMDMWRRIGEGRLAEVLGPSFVERDRFARMWRYRGDMTAEWTSYAPDTKAIAAAFVAGVNAYIAQVRERPPVEYTLLHLAPEPWTPDVPLQRMAALSMTGNADYEVLRARLVQLIGAERASAILPTIPHRDLDPAPGLSFAGVSGQSLGAYEDAAGPLMLPRVVGSNNWVVSGSHTVTGKPLLANDPHRYLDNPSLRYLAHLVAPGWNVIGAGEPGVPGIAAGHNARIGFGFTIVGMDQQDVYIETLSRCASRRRCYLHDGVWKPLRIVVDTIRVKGERARAVRLEFTAHGPLVHEDSVVDARGHTRGYALRFVGSEPGTAGYLAQLSVDRAFDWSSFLAAAGRWKLPTENLIYADVDGNIGWIAAGLMPKRTWSGLLPVPGTGGFEWSGYRSVGELPKAFNPARGFIVTANHDIRPEGYSIPLNYEFATPYRARRITEVLSDTTARFGVEDFERLQHDVVSLQARSLVPELLAAAHRAGRDTLWEYQQLASWDSRMRADGAAPLLFELWKRALSRGALRRLVSSADAMALLGGGETWLDEWSSPDDALAPVSGAARDTLMLAAMDSAVALATRREGANRSTWRWGALHTASFDHHVASAFDPAPVERAGDGNTVNATGGYGYTQQYGASYREILDFADWDRSVATSVPGQSGQPESEFYANLLPMWAAGEYFPLAYSRAAVERETKYILWLTPVAPRSARR